MMNAHVRDNLNIVKTSVADDGLLNELVVATILASANVTTGETDLAGYTYTVAAGKFADGEGLEIHATGTLAANTNTKTLRIDVGGQKVTLVLNTTNVASNVFNVRVRVIRNAATTAILTGTSSFNAASGAAPTVWHFAAAISSLTWSGATIVKLTAQSSAASNDIIMSSGQFEIKAS
jgi:hypothetical protein